MTKLARLCVLVLVTCGPLACRTAAAVDPDVARWEQQAQRVSIVRDDWGLAHVRGKTDADAVFGMMYAQAEDDFNRVETNFINAMGRLAEAEGEREIYRDLRMKLFIDPADIQAQYEASPAWLKALMQAWADGLNYYLHTHPAVTPRVIRKFDPWMALTFSEGSIGGDIERVNLRDLEAFYGKASGARQVADADLDPADPEPSGSNGMAIAPGNTRNGRALLLINPHTSFFFRNEMQVTSDEGLNAYGAATWGQFFIYQGFNEGAGWMHTSSGVDAIDEYLETIVRRSDGLYYKYGSEERRVTEKKVTVPYRTATGRAERTFTVYRTHHGPIVREADGKWVAIRLMEDPVKALTQSYTRTKAKSYQAFKETMGLHTNSSNNTIFADREGNIAYFHANFIPRRDPRFDWTKPVDGSDPATEWNGVLSVDESPNVFNPSSGWLFNTNNWPFTAAGPSSPKQGAYPKYVENGGENPRGVNAIRLLSGRRDFTLDSLSVAAYDPALAAFDDLLPGLFEAFDQTPASNPFKAKLTDQVAVLRAWDRRWAVTSVPTSLAVFWGEELGRLVRADAEAEDLSVYEYMARRSSPAQRLQALATASDQLTADFGTWKTPWGDINRFQRLTGDIVQPFSDSGPSLPVGFTSSRWGSLASFGARRYPGTKKWYGTSGNSFVAVVEFGETVKAKAVTAGGVNSDPRSKFFNNQAERYAAGDLREVYFYPEQLKGHTVREYRPGAEGRP
jgi:acyl-homoserine-lactone acylase